MYINSYSYFQRKLFAFLPQRKLGETNKQFENLRLCCLFQIHFSLDNWVAMSINRISQLVFCLFVVSLYCESCVLKMYLGVKKVGLKSCSINLNLTIDLVCW